MKTTSYSIIAFLLMAVLFSCKNEPNSPTTESLKATFLSLHPESGRPGDTVTIVGTNLLTDSVKSVYFDVSESSIIYFSNDSLRVVVPQLASGSYFVKFKTKTEEIDSALQFRVLPIVDLPVLSGFFPKEGMPGTQVTLKGSGFAADTNLSVFFGDSLATIVSVCNDSICVLTPTMPAGNAKIRLRSGYDELIFAEDFSVLKKPIFYSTNKVAITISSLPVLYHYSHYTSDIVPPPGFSTYDTITCDKDINWQKNWKILFLRTTNENNVYNMKFGNNPITYEDWIVFQYDEEQKKIRNLSMQLTDIMKYNTDFQKEYIVYDLLKLQAKEADFIETDSSMIISLQGASFLDNLVDFNYNYDSDQKFSWHYSERIRHSYKYLQTATPNSSIKIEIIK